MGGIGNIYIEGFGWIPSISSSSRSIAAIPKHYLIEGIYEGNNEKTEQRKYFSFSENEVITMAKSDELIKLIRCEEIKDIASFSEA